jgi:autotransporter-associated beta strand protein
LGGQTNGNVTYQMVLGQNPVLGSQVWFYNSGSPFQLQSPNYTVDTFNGAAWSPGTPILTNAQAAFFFVPCTTNPCITMTSATNKTVPCDTNWNFDAPTNIVDNCCTNYNVSFTTATNSGPCPWMIARTWTVSDSCSNIATCTQTVTVVDTTAPVFAATHCVTNVFTAGNTTDNFVGPEPASPSAGLTNRLRTQFNAQFKQFDDCTVNTFLAHTFSDLPSCEITSATLTVRVKPCGDICDNDTLELSFTDTNGVRQAAWGRFFGAGNSESGLLTNNWCSYTDGVTFTLNLAQLSRADGSTVNLLADLNLYRFLDVVLEDDSAVDYLELTVVSCCCACDKTVECGQAWTFDQPVAWDQCCGTNVSVWLDSSNCISAGPCPVVWIGVWKAMDCCSNIATCTQTVTVVDTMAPVIQCPSNIVVFSCTNVTVDYSNLVTATDACCSNVTVAFYSSSGMVFAPDTTNTIYCMATDCCTNSATNAFTVTVLKRQTIVGLFNTGVDDNRNLLDGGDRDYHYALGVNPDGEAFFVVVDTNAIVMQAWLADSAVSQWISPRSDGNGYAGSTAYDYQVKFTLPCTNDVIITGRWAADNSGSIMLNSNSIADPVGRLSGNAGTNFSTWHAFTITSGFVAGENTLDFWVTNSSGYTGLRVELSGTSACCCSNTIQISCSDIITNSSVDVVLTSYPVTVTDGCCSNLTVWYDPAPPHSFATGTSNSVTCWASDCAGNLASNTFAVVVVPGPNNTAIIIKANNTDPLNQPTSWTNNVVPSANNFAVWNSIVTPPNTTNNLGSDQTWGGIQILDPAAPITITGSNTLTLIGVTNVGIDMSSASQDLTVACPLTVNSNQAWMIGSGRMLQMNSVLVAAPFQVGGFGWTHINTMEGDGVYPVDFNGSSYTEIGSVGGNMYFQVDGSATLALTGSNSCTGPVTVNNGRLVLQSTASNTVGGVCSALVTNLLTVNDGATLQLLSDTTVNFTGGALPVLAGNVTLNVGSLTAGVSNRTVSLGAAALICSGSNNIINFLGSTNGYTLDVGVVKTHGGPASIVTAGLDVHVSGISSNGIYPADFTGSSYTGIFPGEFIPEEDTCGSIVGVASFTKHGTKPLLLWATNNYSGLTTVSDGPLVMNGSLLGGGAVNVTGGGTLCGTGMITGPVFVQSGATCAVKSFFDIFWEVNTGDSAALTINNTLSLAGTTWLMVNRTNTPNSERIVGMTTVTYGGTLTVTNRGPALQAGDTFMLFSAANYAGPFAATNLPALASGLTWNTSQLAVNGSISVVTTGPAIISFQVITGGGGFNLNWPANQGWILQQATNLLGSWNDVGTTTNSYQVVPAQPSQFFRLRSGP